MDLGLTGRSRARSAAAVAAWVARSPSVLAAEGARRSGSSRDPATALRRGRGTARCARGPGRPSTPDGPAAAVTTAVEAFGGLDLLVVNSGGPPAGRFEDLDEAAWASRHRRDAVERHPPAPRGAAPPARGPRPGDPGRSSRARSASRSPALTTSNLIRPGLAGLIKSLVEEIAPVRINGLAAGPVRHRPDRAARRRPARPPRASRSRRSSAGRSSGSRSGATASRWSSAGSARSCSRRPRRT